MKVYGGVAAEVLVFLTQTLVGGEWSASYPGRLTPKINSTLFIGG
jgi:hypothetical protein